MVGSDPATLVTPASDDSPEGADDPIVAVGAATIRAKLPAPFAFGSWRIAHREYALVSVRARSGVVGRAWTLTRDGPVGTIVEALIAPCYVGRRPDSPDALREAALASNRPILSAGVGLRALSLVDLATWDLAARQRALPIASLLGGQELPLPATAVVGYPPSRDGHDVGAEVEALVRRGWRRFKLPAAATTELTIRRVRAAAVAAAGGSVSLDGAWLFRDAATVADLLEQLAVPLDWIEDVVPPGDLQSLIALRAMTTTPVAMGDEQGGPHFPDALLAADAVDVVRLDATCMGGLGPFVRASRQVTAAGKLVAPHMLGHIHAPILGALGLADSPIEWSAPGSGMEPYGESLAAPEVVNGRSMPPNTGPGFGSLVNSDWIADQEIDDPADSLVW
jgi:L-alanine-DL-glutamate epimerase-like enolase superfamily enzyme